jgi:ribosome-interacting GTPase 1
LLNDKEALKKRMQELKDKLKNKDANRDDLASFVPLINEIKDIRRQLELIDADVNKVGQNIKFLKNKYGGVDVEKKVHSFHLDSDNLKSLINDL